MGRIARPKIYQRPGKDIWYMQYTADGKRYRRSAETTSKEVAQVKLDDIMREIREGIDPAYRKRKLTLADLEKRINLHYRAGGKKDSSIQRMQISVKYLLAFFGKNRLLHTLTGADLDRYKAARREDRIGSRGLERGWRAVQDATINRDLACLKQGCILLANDNDDPKLRGVARKIGLLKEHPAPTYPFGAEEIPAFLAALPDYLRPPVIFGLSTGWRERTILDLTWEQVDRGEQVICIPPYMSKNKEPMRMELGKDSDAMKIIRSQWVKQNGQPAGEKVVALRTAGAPACAYVFDRDGMCIKDFRCAWNRACTAAGVTGYGSPRGAKRRTFHSLRSTVITRLQKEGTAPEIGKQITGHQTDEAYSRYARFGKNDVRETMNKQPSYLEKEIQSD